MLGINYSALGTRALVSGQFCFSWFSYKNNLLVSYSESILHGLYFYITFGLQLVFTSCWKHSFLRLSFTVCKIIIHIYKLKFKLFLYSRNCTTRFFFFHLFSLKSVWVKLHSALESFMTKAFSLWRIVYFHSVWIQNYCCLRTENVPTLPLSL